MSARHPPAGDHRGAHGGAHGGAGGERAGGGAGPQGAGVAGLHRRAQHHARFSPITPRRAHRPDSWDHGARPEFRVLGLALGPDMR